MQVIRFDTEVSVEVAQHGSRFRIGPLVGDDARVRVQLMYLAPDGAIGRHDAAGRQLLAIVDGTAWVSGDDGVRRHLAAGWGAIWEPGESHEAGSDRGCTAVNVEGEFTSWAAAVTKDIVVADYDTRWPAWFEQLREHVWPAVRDVALRIDHVGSTSVPGLAAKPIIDMDIVVANDDMTRGVIEGLRGIGYRCQGDLGVAGRQAYVRDMSDGVLPEHHLYSVVEHSRPHLDHILLRDLLRDDATSRAAYGELKRRSAARADRDIDVYVADKAELVAELLTRARAERGLPEVEYWHPHDT